MKKGKLLEIVRVAIMCAILEKEGNMSPTELRSFLRCKNTLIMEYARSHDHLFDVSNNGISSKKIYLKPNDV